MLGYCSRLFRTVRDYSGTIRDYSGTIWDCSGTIRGYSGSIQDYSGSIWTISNLFRIFSLLFMTIRDYLEEALTNLRLQHHNCNVLPPVRKKLQLFGETLYFS